MKTLKNIFSRSTSLWLALELILVTVICWWTFAPVLENLYLWYLPYGYDADRMVRMEVVSTLNGTERMNRQEEICTEEEMLLRKVQEIDDVELAFRTVYTAPGFSSHLLHCKIGDSTWIRFPTIYFQRESPIFKAYGIQSLTPEVSTSELTNDCEEDKTIILSRTFAMAAFGTTGVAGRTIQLYYVAQNEFKEYRIRAVVEDVRQGGMYPDNTIGYVCSTQGQTLTNRPIIVRLREGVSAEQFREKCEHELLHTLMTEHCYIRKIETVWEQNSFNMRRSKGRLMGRNILIAAFFAINMAFGVFGTLLMYMRQRREEAGVRRAFGATRWSVFWGFIREAWLLTTVSVLIGCIIYFQYQVSGDFYETGIYTNPAVHHWFDSIETHFPIVSLCVYLYILCTVLIGTAIPAWRICRSKITEAIKEE
ncbi:MAG: ABC transporter permease [Bacteroidaceae bacterium]|nr:ABC transporter permease [Bacteroidaceae bacterium]